MTDLMKIVLALTVSGTALAAVLALLRRVLRDRLPKAVFYYLWLLVLLRLIVPAALPVPGLEKTVEPPAVQIQTPATPVQIDPGQPVVIPSATTQTTPAQPSAPVPQQVSVTPWYQPAWAFLCDRFAVLWLAGAALHFLWFAVSYLRFSRGLKEDCVPLLEHEQALLDVLRGEVKVTACRSPLARTPMLLGLVRPRIILPETPITTRELEYILRHELTHLRRRDLLYKWFTVAVTSVHWFNPLMPWLRREIARCGELSCDEGIIASMDAEHKRQYGETLLALAAAGALPRGVPATTLCEEKTQLKERLVGIVKYRKATLLVALLSAVLALLVAGCAAVLGPQLKKETFTGPLTEEQQAPVLENIRAWAEENVQADGELTITYSEPTENPQGMGSLVEIATTYLYDLSTNTIRPVDGTYPDSAALGVVHLTVKAGENYRDIRTFYLSRGGTSLTPDPIASLKQFAAAYPDATARYLSWEQRNGQPVYIKIFFNNEGRENIFEYSGVCGRWGVREKDSDSGKRAAIPLADLPRMMERIVQWQTANGGDTDGRNFTLVNGMTLETPASHGILDQVLDDWQTVQVYNMATGDLYTLEGDYTGAVEYGCFTLLNVEDPESRIFLIDNDDKDPVTPEPEGSLAGQVAVLTKNAPLDNAFVQTVDTEGRTVVVDMAMALKKGDLVYVESQEGETCTVTVLSGEPPRPQGWLDETILATDIGSLQEANQVIMKDTKMWHGDPDDGVFSDSACTGVANVEERKEDWYCVTLPGGGDPFWVRREDVSFLWPLAQPAPDLSGKSYYYEGGGFSGAGDFTISLHEDGTFSYYEGLLSSHIGMGSWTVEDDTLVLREDTFSRVFRFRVEDGGLSYIQADSSSFTYVKLEDGARFLEDTQTVEPETSFLYQKTADWLAQEFHQVYDPYYDVQSLTISNWQESGSEATFHYKMCWLNYNRDPDTVDYVVQAKKAGQAAYETLYNDYLALKEANYIFKIVWEGEQPLLYSDVSPTGPEEWEPTEVRDFVLRPKTN